MFTWIFESEPHSHAFKSIHLNPSKCKTNSTHNSNEKKDQNGDFFVRWKRIKSWFFICINCVQHFGVTRRSQAVWYEIAFQSVVFFKWHLPRKSIVNQWTCIYAGSLAMPRSASRNTRCVLTHNPFWIVLFVVTVNKSTRNLTSFIEPDLKNVNDDTL